MYILRQAQLSVEEKKSITFKDFSGMAFGSKIIGISDDYSGKSMTNPTVNKKFKKTKNLVS